MNVPFIGIGFVGVKITSSIKAPLISIVIEVNGAF